MERQPVVLLLDTSASMARPPDRPRIDELNAALAEWFEGEHTARLRSRVEVCLLTFDSQVRVYDPQRAELVPVAGADPDALFVPLGRLRPPRLVAGGLTRMTEAVEAGLDLAAARHRSLQRQQVMVRRPFLWLLTDGAPSDPEGRPLDARALAPVAQRVRRAEARDACVFQAIGVRGADLALLRVLAPKAALYLDTLGFRSILEVLFQSSDRLGAASEAEETHAHIRQQAENRRLAEELEKML
ncbi:hypothetical protein LG634_04645 [Streptomyces bambusae]|nr:hypothetical protein [Streptomyces bambusae]